MNQPPPRNVKLSIALPFSYGETEHTLLLRTLKWGIIARLAAVYRVDNIVLYNSVVEPVSFFNRKLALTVLRYLVVAPYLRRLVYPRMKLLRYAGVLPPLQLPTHGVGGPRVGECRQGLVIDTSRNHLVIEAGLGRPVSVEGLAQKGQLVLVEVEDVEPPRIRLGCRTPVYNGYRVLVVESLRKLLNKRDSDVVIATSRLGEVYTYAKAGALLGKAKRGILVLFGSPWRGLAELSAAEGFSIEEAANAVWNTIPLQGTRTVRVEEAVSATLALINTLSS